MSQPPIPPVETLRALVTHMQGILSGELPFGDLPLMGMNAVGAAAEAEDDSPWPTIPGPGKGSKGGMSGMELGAFVARLVSPESLYHVVTPKGMRYRKLTSILGDHLSAHAALISVWFDQAGLLEPATDPERPWSEARLLTTEDLMQIAAQLTATPLPTAATIAHARTQGLK